VVKIAAAANQRDDEQEKQALEPERQWTSRRSGAGRTRWRDLARGLARRHGCAGRGRALDGTRWGRKPPRASGRTWKRGTGLA
jgi:hypothetical protein